MLLNTDPQVGEDLTALSLHVIRDSPLENGAFTAPFFFAAIHA